MNLYVVVEGQADKAIYEHWITYVNPLLKKETSIENIDENKFFIISGGGYPFYFDVIGAAIQEVNDNLGKFDRLVISVDSEDFSKEEKLIEMQEFVSSVRCQIPIYIVIQHFCIETWGLGNLKIGPRNPKHAILKEYKNIFNVLTNDPELLPNNEKEGLNRAQFAYKYLRALLNDKNKNLTYTKYNPKALQHIKFFDELKIRNASTNHIQSFSDFVLAFT